MDPQQRLLLQLAYQAVRSAELYDPEIQAKIPQDVGCYLGVGSVDYENNIASHPPQAYSALGSLRAFLSGKISHHFGWLGPSITFDTACSSSAVAIHAACKAILAGECSAALAGGVNVITSPYLNQNLAAASFLSPSGPTKAFDQDADGYCRGEGAGLVYLKKLSAALADGDDVLGVIASSAVTQGSNDTPITVPDSRSQVDLFKRVLAGAGLKPEDVSYVEAHGTGTVVGDPIECASIRSVFGGSRRSAKLHIGSVKSNVGHTEAASGVAALIKTVLMIQSKTIPPQANFQILNSAIAPLEPDQMAITIKSSAWKPGFQAACVNNYGAAGSNAALIVCQPPASPSLVHYDHKVIARLQRHLLSISAHSLQSLQSFCYQLKKKLEKSSVNMSEEDLIASIAFRLAHKQDNKQAFRVLMTPTSLIEIHRHLLRVIDCSDPRDYAVTSHERPTVFLFGGQNGQNRLHRSVYDACRVSQKHLDSCNRSCLQQGLPAILPAVFQTCKAESLIHEHCMLFSLQYACAQSWFDGGLKPNAVIGHSFGQITALCMAGSITLADALRLVSERARLIELRLKAGAGAMLAVEGARDVLTQALDTLNSSSSAGTLEIACFNGPTSHVISGSAASIVRFERLAATEAFCTEMKPKKLPSEYAYHSAHMDLIMPDLHEIAKNIDLTPPSIPIELCVLSSHGDGPDREFLADQSRQPVYFAQAVQRVEALHGSCLWLEAGCDSPIINMARRAVDNTADDGHIFQTIKLGTSDSMAQLADATCNLWRAGVNVQFWPYQRLQRSQYQAFTLPPYQFDTSRHWLDFREKLGEPQTPVTKTTARMHSLLRDSPKSDPARGNYSYEVDTSSALYQSCVRGHAVLGHSLCPASVYMELVYQAAALSGNAPENLAATDISIEDLKVKAPLGVKPNAVLEVVLTKQAHPTFSCVISSMAAGSKYPVQHATCTVIRSEGFGGPHLSHISSLQRLIRISRPNAILNDANTNRIAGHEAIYGCFRQFVRYGNCFKGLRELSVTGDESAGRILMPSLNQDHLQSAMCNPFAIDCYLQVAGLHINTCRNSRDDLIFVCTGMQSVRHLLPMQKKSDDAHSWTVYATVEEKDVKHLICDIFVFDDSTPQLGVIIQGANFAGVNSRSLARTLSLANKSEDHEMAGNNQHLQDTRMRDDTGDTVMADVSLSSQTLTPGDDRLWADVCSIIDQLTGASSITHETTLDSLGIDSIMAIELQTELKRAFGIHVELHVLLEMTSLGQLCDFVGSQRGQLLPVKTQESLRSSKGRRIDNATISTLKDVLSNLLGISTHFDSSSRISDLGIDSLMMTELHTDLKKTFDTKIELNHLFNDPTLNELASLLKTGTKAAATLGTERRHVGGYEEDDLPRQKLKTAEAGKTAEARTLSEIAKTAFEDLRVRYDEAMRSNNLSGFYQDVYPRQSVLVTAYILEAFDKLGCSLTNLQPREPLPNLMFLPKHSRAVQQYHEALEEASLIRRGENDSWCRTEVVGSIQSASDLHESIVRSFPQHASEHKLLRVTGAVLAECLKGEVDPLQLLFRDQAAKKLLEDVYTSAPMFSAGTDFLVQLMSRIMTEASSTNKPIRILELGAGTGGTTKALINALSKYANVHYTFSDISASLVATAKKKFARYHASMDFIVLDIESPPAPHLQSAFDIIIGTNCVHATKSLVRSCTNARSMLKGDGMMFLVELMRNLEWFDLVFGLLEGWWLFEDGRGHALAGEEVWERTLKEAGFGRVVWTEGEREEASLLRVLGGFC